MNQTADPGDMRSSAPMRRKDFSVAPGLVIAITDIFLSATATFLVILALSATDPPVAAPVQADLLVACPTAPNWLTGSGSDMLIVDATGILVDGNAAAAVSRASWRLFRDEATFSRALEAVATRAKMLQTLGLFAMRGRPVTADCLDRLQNVLVRSHNRRAGDADRRVGPGRSSLPIVAMQVIDLTLDLEFRDE